MRLDENSPFIDYLDTPFAKEFGSFFLPLRNKEEELQSLTVLEALKRLPMEERFIPDTIEGMNDALRRMEEEKDFAHTIKTNPAAKYLSYPVRKEKGKVLILPGGGYQCVAGFVEGYPIAKELNESGYSAYVLNYSVGVEAKFPRPMFDVADSLHDIIPEGYKRYAVLGFSAGGHLAASICLKKNQDLLSLSSRPAVLGLGYPVISCLLPTHGGSRDIILGEYKDNPMFQESLSIERFIDEEFPPTFCWCGEYDDCVPSINSHALEKSLSEKSIKRKFIYGNFSKHGLGRGKNSPIEGWIKNFASFLDENLCKFPF